MKFSSKDLFQCVFLVHVFAISCERLSVTVTRGRMKGKNNGKLQGRFRVFHGIQRSTRRSQERFKGDS